MGTILLAVTIIISNFHDKMFAASKQQLLDRDYLEASNGSLVQRYLKGSRFIFT
jgi:hypothetical protein